MRAGRGRATVAAVWIILAVAYGVYFSFSIFLVPLLEEFGWSRALTAGAFSMSAVVQGVLAPVTGILVDRVGARRVIIGGAVVLGGASLLASTIRTPWQLYVYTGVIGAIGLVALGWVPMGVLLSHWFAEGRVRDRSRGAVADRCPRLAHRERAPRRGDGGAPAPDRVDGNTRPGAA
jgi:MFS family permease